MIKSMLASRTAKAITIVLVTAAMTTTALADRKRKKDKDKDKEPEAEAEIEVKDESSPPMTPSEPEPEPMRPSAAPMQVTGAGPFKSGTLGISVAVPGAANIINFIYFLDDKAAIDLIGGVSFVRAPVVDPATGATTDEITFGFSAGLGYRMYKHLANNIHTYIEPYGLVSSPSAGDIGENIAIQVGVSFGVECMLTDWFSFRGQLGGAVQFVGGADVIQAATTTGLFGTVYWK